MVATRKCGKCGLTKPLRNFRKNADRCMWCQKQIRNEQVRNYRKYVKRCLLENVGVPELIEEVFTHEELGEIRKALDKQVRDGLRIAATKVLDDDRFTKNRQQDKCVKSHGKKVTRELEILQRHRMAIVAPYGDGGQMMAGIADDIIQGKIR
jgi:hypothetical protein